MILLFQEWRELLRREFSGYRWGIFQKDLLAGLTVAAVALPLALAFGVASGADAAAGLVTAILAGIVIGIFSGAPYQISGPTGAMSAVLIVLASRYGLQGVFLAGLLSGVMILFLGIFRLGRVVSLIPAPVISGFTSGIAVIISLGQIDNFLGIKTPSAENVIEKIGYYIETGVQPNLFAVVLALVVMVVMVLWPRLPGSLAKQIPGSLVGIIAATAISAIAGWQVPEIGAIPRTILLENRLRLTEIDWRSVSELVVPAMSIAALGAIESLLCGAVAGNMTGIRMYNSVELAAQGIGNILIPFFGGVPATAAIARTSVNVKSGGATRMTSILHGAALLAAALLLAPVIGRVPLAALAGVLLMTAWRMNEWKAIHFFFGKRLKHAMIAFAITLAATVLLDLTQAILIGFGISTLMFMAQMSDLHVNRQAVDAQRMAQAGHQFVHPGSNLTVYYVSGPLFFAAARKLIEEIEAKDTPEDTIILSMRGVPLVDATGVEVLRELWHRQHHGGGELLLASVQPRVDAILERMGFMDEITCDRVFWSADRAILSLGAPLPETSPLLPLEGKTGLEAGQEITPHEERGERGV
jgi:SulP family sulfate permease